MKRKKYRAKNESLRNTSTDSKGTAFVILINHASAPIRKERLSPTSKARREVSQIEFMEKGGMPDRVDQSINHGSAVPNPVWVGWKWLLDFPRVPVTSETPQNKSRCYDFC